ncbi:MAG: 5-methylcytosine-specific restriction endonuclease system specificity protein McrC [Solobacterium sp.]|nr:5-methylcytosine-specific restriction endonuclease system specificity protein McrC [Solobacterium sp.]
MNSSNSIVISNIYYMLTYAFQVLHQSNYDEIASEPFDNIQDLFAAILSKGIAQQLKQGLHREYIERTEDLSVMHGRIDINGTIRNLAQDRKLLSCEYDELSENNIFNQILKTTVMLLLKEDSVREESKAALKMEMLFFTGVDEIDPFLIHWNMLRFNRNNQSYHMLLSICQFVLEGLLLTTDDGDMKLAQFLDEQRMCRLYEKFILEFYRKEVPAVNTSSPRIEWQIDDGTNMLLPAMQSDIMLTYGEKTLIIDAKYYTHATQVQYGKHTLHSQNLYQIFTYVMNQDVGKTGNVAGLLLYAKTDEDIAPDVDTVIMGHKISAKTLDLNCDFKTISVQLRTIAKMYFSL